MELPKVLLGAILLGITTGTISCSKGSNHTVQPVEQQNADVLGQGNGNNPVVTPYDCPACGMG